ncbi:plasma-membrane choline transporter-domain-containing protein [Filobasidium floriforme]|uniref:plasma-membrane choline transporter-domain-containing protein n=1 Tax=Filobasidium floriforme TaxID=5210 RepID=UPI001E8E7B5E|nr:plasma-membrane choline transporter-domain-containing protein [Filobasidium floriforme]KAH8080812.1 plasma-membrane choline transporter-domain-containing protein [Filobasidium floriforme]
MVIIRQATAVVIPFMLCVTSWWAFIASFEDDSDIGGPADPGGRWWSSTGLRLFALVPFALAILFGRMVWKRRKRLERTVAVVELSSSFLLDHPPVLLLTPALLMVFAVLSIPYLTLLLRLLLIGYYRHPRENTYIWHVKPYADILIVVVSLLWLWTWVVVKGVGRVVTAAVISEWYFHRNDRDPPATVDLTVAAIHRATGPSLGSICLSSLIVAVMRFLGRVAIELRRALNSRSGMLPIPVDLVAAISPVIVMLSGLLDYVNGYALIYVGVTGEAFWPSAKRAIGLAGRRKGSRLLDYTLIKLLLTLSSTTIALATAVVGYLYAAHALSAASHAPLAALLCGGVPFFAVRACAGVLGDASDALFICLAIDEAIEGDHCTQAKAAVRKLVHFTILAFDANADLYFETVYGREALSTKCCVILLELCGTSCISMSAEHIVYLNEMYK